jgi:transcriptional regulator GlxA family with amidase domain
MAGVEPRRVVIYAAPSVQSLDVAGPYEVFAAANAAARLLGVTRRRYEVVVAGDAAGATVRAESGLTLVAEVSLAAVGSRRGRPVDTLLVAGGRGPRRAAGDAGVVTSIRRAASRARRVASVCTGAYLLAAAGLLDGRRATTHWAYCDDLARRYPAVRVERDPIYVRDGAVWTSAGVTAGIDLGLAMVEADCGREIAAAVARGLVVFVRRAGGQSQFSAPLLAQAAERAPIRDVVTWVLDHPTAPLDVPSLARRAGMSVRNFSRVFAAETGLTPAAWAVRARVEVAERLLEATSRSIEEVAARSGFGTPQALRRAFARCVGVSPREYRARFGAPPMQGGAS